MFVVVSLFNVTLANPDVDGFSIVSEGLDVEAICMMLFGAVVPIPTFVPV